VNYSFNFIQAMNRDSPIIRQSYGIQPKFAIMPFVAYVNMGRFAPFVRVEMETIWAYSENCGHLSLNFSLNVETRQPACEAQSSG